MVKRTVGRKESGAFTLIELLVVIAIIAILAAILFPVFAKAREKARTSSCASNSKQLMLGLLQYVQDFDERMILRSNNIAPWSVMEQPYLKSGQIFACPSNSSTSLYATGMPAHYGLNNSEYQFPQPGSNDGTRPPWSLSQVDRPSESIAIAEKRQNNWTDIASNWWSIVPAYWDTVYAGHNTMMNLSFMDGHVKLYKPSATSNPNLWYWSSGAPNPTIDQGMSIVTGNFP